MRKTAQHPRGKTGIVASLLLVLALMLSACGATVDTNLSFSKDGKGTRTITATLSTENLSEHVEGGLKAITASLKKHTPEQLNFKGLKENKEENEAIATFTMAFDSFEDYEKKINELLLLSNKESAAEINTVIESNDFVNGFATEENFTSSELLTWAKDGLVSDGVIEESNASNVFSDGTSKVKYEGKDYESSSARINVDKIKDHGFDEINVNTTLNEDGTFEQEIIYLIDKEKAKKLGDKLTGFLAKATVDGQLEDYYGEASKNGYTQKFGAADSAQLSSKTNQALGSEKVSYQFVTEPSSDKPATVITTLKASVDCNTICSPSGHRVIPSISFPPSYSYLDSSDITASTGKNDELVLTARTSNFTAQAQKTIPLQSAHVDTSIGFDRSITQRYTFAVSQENADLAGEGFISLLTPEENVGSLETKQADNLVQYLVKISADSAEELSTKLNAYPAGATVNASYDPGFAFWPEYRVSLGWSPAAQLGIEEFTQGVSTEVHLPFAHKFIDSYTNSGSPELEGKNLKMSDQSFLDANLSASGPTMGSFIALAILVFLILLGLALLFIFRKRLGAAGKKVWDQRDEALAAGKKAASGVAAAGAAAAAGVSASVAAATATGAQPATQEQHTDEFTEADLL